MSAQHKGLDEMADLVAGTLRDVGFDVESVAPGSIEAPSVVLGRMSGRGDRVLLSYNPYDVQPADPLDQRTTPPFVPDLRDGKVYGRGTADNKGSIV